jgi:hypothetical protein
MSEPHEWKVLENVKNPICPLISTLTVKQANKYVECLKEKCMWWNKCKGLEEQRPHEACNQCLYYDGVHGVDGHAPCYFWGIGGVLSSDYCSRFKKSR